MNILSSNVKSAILRSLYTSSTIHTFLFLFQFIFLRHYIFPLHIYRLLFDISLYNTVNHGTEKGQKIVFYTITYVTLCRVRREIDNNDRNNRVHGLVYKLSPYNCRIESCQTYDWYNNICAKLSTCSYRSDEYRFFMTHVMSEKCHICDFGTGQNRYV